MDPRIARPAPVTTAVLATDSASADPVSPAGSAGLADLVAMLRTAAHAPGMLVIIGRDGDTGAEATSLACLPTAQIRVGAGLLTDQHSIRLQGALAHEVAHHALGHLAGPSRWQRLATGCGIGALLALAARLPAWFVIAAAAVAALTYLLAARAQQREEYQADAHSMRLLDAAGLDGRAIVTVTLAALPQESRSYRLAGWIVGSHPTPDARRRAVLAAAQAR